MDNKLKIKKLIVYGVVCFLISVVLIYIVDFFVRGVTAEAPKPLDMPLVRAHPLPVPPPIPPKPKVTETKVKEVAVQANNTASKSPAPKANSTAPSSLHGEANGFGNEIGGGGGLYGLYLSGLQNAVKRKLKEDDKTRQLKLGGKVRLFINEYGLISKVQIISSSGDAAVDAAYQILVGIDVGLPPGRFNFVDENIRR